MKIDSKKININFVKSSKFISGLTFLTPIVCSAGAIGPSSNFGTVVESAVGVIYILIPAFLSLAILLFFFGVAKFLLQPGNKTEVENGKKYMFWGIITIFVLLSSLVIVGQIRNALGLGGPDADVPGMFLPIQ